MNIEIGDSPSQQNPRTLIISPASRHHSCSHLASSFHLLPAAPCGGGHPSRHSKQPQEWPTRDKHHECAPARHPLARLCVVSKTVLRYNPAFPGMANMDIGIRQDSR